MSNNRRDTPPTLSVNGGLRPRSPAEALEPGRAPPRPNKPRKSRKPRSRKVSRFVRVFSGVMTLAVVALLGVLTISAVLFHQFEKPGPLQVTRTVSIPKGEGRIEIARRLEREGIISSRWAFVAGYLVHSGWRTKKNADLKAGEYEIKKGASMRHVLQTLIEGKSVLYKVTIPEGLTSQQVVARLNAAQDLSGEITEIPPEGSILPNTYSFSKNADRSELLARMKVAQNKVLSALWQSRQPDLPIKTPEEAVILASIVEKETGRSDERDRVAGVFINRLRKGMRLQSDPTIIYGIVGGKGRLDRPITRKDISEKTAYNTYRINGLPPGPICNPGRAALAATLNPAKTEDFYFVADGTGGHTFSKTLKAHNAAVKKWREIERERRREEAARNAQQANNTSTVISDSAIPNPSTSDAAASGDAQVPPIADIVAGLDATKAMVKQSDATVNAPADATPPEPLSGLRASTVPLPVRRPPQ